MAALGQLSRCQDVPPDSTSGSPPVIPLLPFQDSQPAQSGPLSVPAIGIPTGSRSNDPFLNQFMVVPPPDIPLPTFEDSEGQASMSLRKSDKLPATTGTTMMPENDATSRHYAPKMPAPTTLPGPEFQPFQPFLVNPFLNMGLHPSLFLPHILPPLPGAAQNASPNNIMVNKWSDTFSQPNLPPHHHPESPTATDLSPDPPDTNSKRLEYYLDSALVTALIIQTSGISSSVDILSPRAYNTLKALNALVSVETPLFCPRTVASDPPTRFKSVRKATRWLRTWNPQAPKENIPK
ncbi:hypothetical protein BYT27DRAFT_6964533 [Phlegmacium glaucopus]|nr:hypothetical protein BYT27DRAFT_6964533 [Phlegmacium glaucopus]